MYVLLFRVFMLQLKQLLLIALTSSIVHIRVFCMRCITRQWNVAVLVCSSTILTTSAPPWNGINKNPHIYTIQIIHILDERAQAVFTGPFRGGFCSLALIGLLHWLCISA